jgi:hypothetical protein
MADKLWEVCGHYKHNGTKKEWNNIYQGKNASEAEKVALKDYNSYVRGGHEKGSFGKLSITKTSEWTKARADAFAKEKGFK